MKVKELKAVLADADDDADVIVSAQASAEGVATRIAVGRNVFETVGAKRQPSGKVSISFDESKQTDYE